VGLRADEPAISASTGEVVLQLGDWPAVERLVKAAARPAVVDVWSTSCQPCMKEFPNLVKLHQELGDRVLCLSLCSDYVGLKKRPPESYRDRALEFLKQQEATLVNVLSSQPDTDLYDAIGIESIPAVLVFDQQGNLAHRFVDAGETVGFTYSKQVIPAVRALLPPEEAP
jgi:thiol-disulfide isomerase/thioredoxin